MTGRPGLGNRAPHRRALTQPRVSDSTWGCGSATRNPAPRLVMDAVAAIREALLAKDPYTSGHSRRVSRYAGAIARALGLPGPCEHEVRLAALLHDIGKIGVPDDLLHRPGPLTHTQHRRVLEHVVIGERILAPLLRERPGLLMAVRSHHERVDGSGFPDGLRGRRIPLAARIIAVADAFDAMTSSRPYRPPQPVWVVTRELEQCAGTQFDGACVRGLLLALRRYPWLRHRRAGPSPDDEGHDLARTTVSRRIAREHRRPASSRPQPYDGPTVRRTTAHPL